jgi:hypothetical protein
VIVYWYVPAVATVCVNESAEPVPEIVPWVPPGERTTVYVTPLSEPLSVIVTLFDTFEQAVGVLVPTLYTVGAAWTLTASVPVPTHDPLATVTDTVALTALLPHRIVALLVVPPDWIVPAVAGLMLHE